MFSFWLTGPSNHPRQNEGMHFEILRDQAAAASSWADAADRRLAELGEAGPVLAVDLSGELLRFRTDPEHRFSIRPMTRGDFPDLVRWVNEPHVARWWDENRSLEQVTEYYGKALTGEDPTRLWIWEVNGRSIGFSQDYRISDHPEYALVCSRPDAIGFDYAIGEPAFAGRGLGTSLLWVFLRDIVWPAYPGAREFFAAPDHRNAASLRALAKLGLSEGVWFDEPKGNGETDTVVGCSLDVAQVMGLNPSTE
ncbi:GNAT family N-acetyltransferase [Nocardioides marmoriginsengisoli]|uniref:Lysine N-acyltransferase MbtK n=1 Tax=Nocardioides marmoriginsengisoli TaxID=661483 RepID=A0A3N0CPP0_9ACTN|nr:GNAT family N-acetyltransferase [Nocardioides marmoriginsengisoli]RNL65434.1 GNAT family N-acetyltransferase [Nocardioides marmoriginsengisoli]